MACALTYNKVEYKHMNEQTLTIATGAQPMIKQKSMVDVDALISEWKLSKSYVEQYTRDFPSLDNLVDGIPIQRDTDAPYVGDTTLPGLVRSIPRDSLQQLPVFSAIVNGSKNNIPALICTFLLKKFVFNEDTFGKGLLSTLQIGAEEALKHGYSPFMVATDSMFNDFGTRMRMLHYSDASLEPGVTDANESSYHYTIAHLTESRVKKIRDRAARNPQTLWNVDMLNKVLGSPPRATDYSQYMSDARKNQSGESAGPTYEFVTRYETGPDATIITFCPEVSDGTLREMDNRSKWGYPRVMYLVIDPAPLIPFGISRVRLASPNQNLMNIYYGNIASMLLLNSKPPIFKRGRFTTPVTLAQGVTWETNDPNAQAELKNLDNGALEQFATFQQSIAAQVQTIMGGQTAAVNQTNGRTGFGKTGPGVKAATAIQDVNTNQITKILENFLRQYALSALDTLFCEQEGDDELIVDDDTKNSINQIKPGYVGDDNKVAINWNDFYDAIEDWSVEITVSLSKDEIDEKKRGDLQDMLVVLAQNAQSIGPQAVQRVEELTNMLMQDKAPLVAPLSTTPPVSAAQQQLPDMAQVSTPVV